MDTSLVGLYKQRHFWGSGSFAYSVHALPINVLQKDPVVASYLQASRVSHITPGHGVSEEEIRDPELPCNLSKVHSRQAAKLGFTLRSPWLHIHRCLFFLTSFSNEVAQQNGLSSWQPNCSFIYKEGVALMLVNIFEGTRKEVEKIQVQRFNLVSSRWENGSIQADMMQEELSVLHLHLKDASRIPASR